MPSQTAAKSVNLQLPLSTLPPLQTTTNIDATVNSTTKSLNALLLASNTLRQRAEVAADKLSFMPRTSAVSHALSHLTAAAVASDGREWR